MCMYCLLIVELTVTSINKILTIYMYLFFAIFLYIVGKNPKAFAIPIFGE